jgi:hypothetical protein
MLEGSVCANIGLADRTLRTSGQGIATRLTGWGFIEIKIFIVHDRISLGLIRFRWKGVTLFPSSVAVMRCFWRVSFLSCLDQDSVCVILWNFYASAYTTILFCNIIIFVI